MSRLVLRLLGPPEVLLDGEVLRLRRRKTLALLAYLATEGGAHQRAKLSDLLWPGSDEARARTALRSVLRNLRKDLGDAAEGRLRAEGDLLSLTNEAESDLRTLREAHDLARFGRRGGAGEAASRGELLTRLEAAASLCRGAFLEGFGLDDAPDFDLWVVSQREAWARRADLVLDRLSALRLDAGEASRAAETAALWAARSPLNEAAHRRLIEALSHAGDREAALEAYEAVRGILEEHLGRGPGPETEALAARLRGSAPSRRGPTSAGATGALEVPFVGRAGELGALVGEYHAVAAGGGPRSAVVLGEAGIGKTRLCCEFLFWVEAEGGDTLQGRAFEAGGGGLPYGPLVGALRSRLERERAPDDLLEDIWLSELSRLLPELGERYPDLPSPSGDEATAKARLFEAVARLVAALSRRAPVVLFVDDLQWADAATLDVLRYGIRRWAEEGAAVLLLICVREEALGSAPAISDWLVALGRDLPARRLSPGSLTDGDTQNLLKALTDRPLEGHASSATLGHIERFARWLHGETHGQPLYLSQTIRDLVEEGLLVLRPEPGGAPAVDLAPAALDLESLSRRVPSGLREVISARLSRTGAGATALLAAGAVLGRGFGFETLARVAALEEDEALAGLDELLRARLLREEGGGYSFVHDRVRDVAHTEAGHARRRVFHRRALEASEEAGAPAAELARHALAAGSTADAFRHLLAAGDAAMAVFAVRDAIGYYERARELLEGGAGGPAPSERPRDVDGLGARSRGESGAPSGPPPVPEGGTGT